MNFTVSLKIGETGSLAPVQELADRLVVRAASILVPNRKGEEFENSLSRFWSDVGNDCWDLEWFGFVKDQCTL